MISSLHINNFKCFESQTFEFTALTLLTGLNGMGKSSVLQSLLLLRQSYQQGLLQNDGLSLKGELAQLGMAQDVFYEGAEDDEFGFSLDFDLETSDHHAACWRFKYEREADDGEIEEQRVRVAHASQPSHIEAHREWIQTRLQEDVQDGSDLWNRRAELLPSLSFCDTVASQIQKLTSTMLRPVTRRLFELEHYCQESTTGVFDPKQLGSKASPESQATLNQYSQERTFLCPDDIERTFSWHLRLTPNAWRLYFIPLPKTRQMIIGYIGPHLRTVKYN